MVWIEPLIDKSAEVCRESLGSWPRVLQLCALILASGAAVALVLWAGR
jgi:hypothetical protein